MPVSTLEVPDLQVITYVWLEYKLYPVQVQVEKRYIFILTHHESTMCRSRVGVGNASDSDMPVIPKWISQGELNENTFLDLSIIFTPKIVNFKMERQLNMPSLPVPEDNPPVIRTRHQNVTISIEVYSVYTTSVLFQLPVNIKSKDKILKYKI
ncbi:DDB1- and CUL4-associated factor 8 [Senna tora]|uniref:DDB1- and CUL4-associated factor 8 n=1 Tax=Senna tora TaxID=362788 RepID=A0A834W721_9FABA|nr:DDB1- and CUL4-associated factor 8 [Senna tora]